MADKNITELLSELTTREERADDGGGRARLERHRRLGRMTARERLSALLDPGSFVELGRHVVHRHAASSEQLAANVHPGDGLICGLGAIEGRSVAIYAHDPTVLRGAMGIEASRKLCRLLDLAAARTLPVVALADSDGVRVDEGTDAIHAYGDVIRRTVQLKGRVAQITLVCGLCVGAAAYTAALTDWVGMVDGQSFMFITGARVTKTVTGEVVDIKDLGGPSMHATKTGACHAIFDDEAAGLRAIKALLGYLRPLVPSDDPIDRATPELEELIPTAPRRGYDMRKVIGAVCDRGSSLEISAKFAKNLLTLVARLEGRAVAVVASQPLALGGCLDADASRKGAAFVTWASASGLPIVTLVDVPGYLPGLAQEQGGILPHGATLLAAYGNARVPLICLVVRKSYGGASVLSFAADIRFALPTARIGPMGADAAIEVSLGPASELATPEETEARAARRDQWLAQHDNAWAPAETGYIDQVLRPRETRSALGRALRQLASVGRPENGGSP